MKQFSGGHPNLTKSTLKPKLNPELVKTRKVVSVYHMCWWVSGLNHVLTGPNWTLFSSPLTKMDPSIKLLAVVSTKKIIYFSQYLGNHHLSRELNWMIWRVLGRGIKHCDRDKSMKICVWAYDMSLLNSALSCHICLKSIILGSSDLCHFTNDLWIAKSILARDFIAPN